MPAAVVDYVSADHLAQFVVALAREHLDLSEIVASYKSGLGQPPFDPRMMTALLLYAYCSGLYSSRRIAKACAEREARCILPLMAKCRLHETWGERVRPNTLRSDLASVIRRSLHLMLPVAERGYATHRTIGDVERPESFIPRPLAHLPGPVAFAPRQSSSLSREPPAVELPIPPSTHLLRKSSQIQGFITRMKAEPYDRSLATAATSSRAGSKNGNRIEGRSL